MAWLQPPNISKTFRVLTSHVAMYLCNNSIKKNRKNPIKMFILTKIKSLQLGKNSDGWSHFFPWYRVGLSFVQWIAWAVLESSVTATGLSFTFAGLCGYDGLSCHIRLSCRCPHGLSCRHGLASAVLDGLSVNAATLEAIVSSGVIPLPAQKEQKIYIKNATL